MQNTTAVFAQRKFSIDFFSFKFVIGKIKDDFQ